jgi:hypothetical protein
MWTSAAVPPITGGNRFDASTPRLASGCVQLRPSDVNLKREAMSSDVRADDMDVGEVPVQHTCHPSTLSTGSPTWTVRPITLAVIPPWPRTAL